jgi:two-component system response regulator
MAERIILLIEDNPDDEELTLHALKENNILNEVVIMRDGADAVSFLFDRDAATGKGLNPLPQLVLLDLKLPKIGGLEILRRIRDDERTRLLPVVILTSSNEEEDVLQGYSRGCNSYIRKPVDFNKFVDSVGQLGLYWLVINESPPIKE